MLGGAIPGLFDVLIIDESHYLGNPNTVRTRAILGKNGLAWKAKRIWCLSGTPATGNAAQLWPLLRAFGVTHMDYEPFMSYFCVLNPYTQRPVGVRNTFQLRALLEPIMLRRTLAEVAPHLPPLTVEEYAVRPDPSYLEESDRVDEQALAGLLNGKYGEDLLAAIPGDQIATLRRYHALLKVNGAAELIKEDFAAEAYERLVVFAHHESVIDLLGKRLQSQGGPAISVRRITGRETAKQKDKAIEWFRAEGGRKVLLGNILAAGTAIDLSRANEGLAVELDWTPGNNVQALRRMLGPAQTLPVRVRVLLAAGTIDDWIVQTLVRKARDLNQIFSQG
jgi:SNF2 family DNA or RNA helicase